MTDTEQKNIFAKNLNYYLTISEKTQKEVADAIQVSPQTFNTWCQGKALPRMGKVQKLADYFHIQKSLLIDKHKSDQGSNKSECSLSTLIPVYASVSAGTGAFADDANIESYIEIPKEWENHGDFFGLRVRGDSMEPEIKDRDIVIVKRIEVVEPDMDNKIVVAIINGDEGFVKRLAMYAEGLSLVSNNTTYRPMYFSAEEVRQLPVRIIGIVQRLVRDM